MPLKVISKEQYSVDKKFKSQRYFVPNLHYSLGIVIYPIPIGSYFYRVKSVKTGEVFGDIEDESFGMSFGFEGNKFCIDYRDAGMKTEDERCLDLE